VSLFYLAYFDHSLTKLFAVLAEDAIRSAIRDYQKKRSVMADSKTNLVDAITGGGPVSAQQTA
jgi:hypothetical protein